MNKIIDCKKIACDIQVKLKEELDSLVGKYKKRPKLVAVMIGEQKGSEIYIKAQSKICETIGIDFSVKNLNVDSSDAEGIEEILKLNYDESVTAMIIQHPLPKNMDYGKITSRMDPLKDAEGIHPFNLGKIFRREAKVLPPTPGAVMKILSNSGIELKGKEVVILGHSPIAGKPLSVMMLNENATTSVCHIATYEKGNIKEHTKRADILVVAVGKPLLVKKDWIKDGAVIVDVGINSINGKVVGDVDLDDVIDKVSMITPVPGGVGPITVAMLIRNVIRCYRLQNEQI
ncbi:MAG: bifunctional 5,10-methylenetetrahydrofolate dehydrogenase/5,10-methenyltetrahydrofolate cyclohydrolase [Candidatus Omnitrophica bacterium]|nr:bifunctional 5,10-methylenetetrahydrofolate dehydrogenase/5,10-methenyltetrahydrofolate cyclohydrolase [Candidatus Omnitrophota bacterium]